MCYSKNFTAKYKLLAKMSVTYSCIREYFILEGNIFWGNGEKGMNNGNKELGLILYFFPFP